jgi:hypothetical protein
MSVAISLGFFLPRAVQPLVLRTAPAAARSGVDSCRILSRRRQPPLGATTRTRIEASCFDAGYDAPVVCTPELLEE